ncbi:DUF1983 domain-containing protein [Superficieibacter sp. 1612_C1]|uniref:TipJ family phage tail tip protein n=1 Tax=Superficieibacter sp. 1612_C1 TaxID=2780382 RepID=UPI00188351E8|nr:DUF1983 domain-containing protein [Superficieibacter sp. 1612_C1]
MATIIGAKGGSKQGHTPVESPDSIQSIARAKMLIALGEGEYAGGLDGKTIFLGDGTSYTPLLNADGSENFPGVVWEFRSGTQDQTYIQGFPGIENELQVSQVLKQNVPYVRAISNTQLSAVRVRVGWETLLWQKDNGDKVGTRVEYAIDLSVDGGAYGTVVNGIVDDKSTTLYERSHRINLPKATTGWQLRIRRVTPDATSVNIVDTMKVQASTEIIDAKLRYPHTALLYIEFDAKQFPNGIPQVVCCPKGRIIRVPDTYDPETRGYSGTWTGAFKWAWTDNPAWIFYDLILNERFGLGQRITADQVDRWELYRIAQYCDQLVPDGKGGTGMEPRFRCNVYIQDRAEAWTVLRDLAGIFRGMTYWGDNRLYVLADMPRDIWHVYNHASVVDGKFTFSDPSETTRYTSAMVNWSDPKNHYKDTPEVVYDNDLAMRYDFRQMEMTAIGCDRQSEANRRGRWVLLTNGAGEVASFATGLDVPPVGEVIGIAANELAGRIIGGRVSAVNGRNITLDRIADIKPGDRLFVNLPSGPAQARTVQAVNGKTVTVTTGWSETPEAETNWAVEADDLYIALFRVTGVSDNNDGTYAITGTTYNPDTYPAIDHGTRLDERPISVIPPGVQGPPVNVTVDSYSSVSQGIAITTLRASWEAVTGAVAYEAEWRKDSGNWVSVLRTSSLGFEVPAIYSGRYLVRVRAVNASDVSSVWAVSPETILTGKTGAPPKPEGLRTQGIVFGVVLNWDFPAGTGDTLKTEIQYSAAASGTNPLLLADVAYPQKTYQQLGLKFGVTFWYRARLVDKTGNQSAWTGWVSGMPADNVADYIDNMDEAIRDTDTYKELDKSIQDNQTAIAKEVTDRAAALTKEASDRTAAISKETTARTQALTKEASDRTAAIAAEATTRAQQDQKVASDAANALLNEQLTREAAITETNLIIQNKTDSLAQSIAQVAAGSGTQFDSLKIWHFNSSGVEGWTGNGTPTVVDNCLRPANHANNPYVVSPASLAVDAASYRFVKLRIRKVGKPAWRGQLRWRDTAAFNDTNMVTLAEPAFDAGGVATIDFSDIKWNTLANVAQIRLDIGATQTASDYFLIDWIAVGRPAPGASTAALEDEATARIAADSAEATARSTLAAQLRGGTDGTDPSKLTSGLIYNERQVRISSEKAIAEDVEALETSFNGNKAAVQQSLEILTDAQTSQGKAITNISASLKYANIDAANMLTNGSFETDFDFWDKRDYPQAQSIINGGAYSGDKVLRFTAYVSASRITQKNILLLKGRTYRLSAVCKFSSDAVAGAGDSTKLAFRNSASDALIKSVTLLANGDTAPTAWTERTLDYTVGNNNDLVVAVAVMSYLTAGTMDIDSVRVMDITDTKAIETKADAGALTTLDGKVKAIGDTVDAQGTALTQVQSSIGRRTVYRAVSVGNGGTGGIGAAGIFKEDGTKLATPARSYMLSVFRTNADGSTTFTSTNFDVYSGSAAASSFNDAVAALPNGTYVAVTTWDEPNGYKSLIFDAIESLGGSREAMGTMAVRSAYILLGCKGIGKGNGQELVSPSANGPDARVFAAIEFINGTMVGLGAGASAIANANASATTALDAKVTQQGKDISTQADAITQLKTDVGGKASQQALSRLSQRVTDAEGDIESQQTAITGLNNSLKNKADASAFSKLETTVKGQGERIDAVETKTVRVDLSAFDPDTYYPVTLALANAAQIRQRIRVVRPFNSTSDWTKPVWSTHTNKNFGLTLEWTTIGSGWGANNIDRNIEEFQYTFAAKSPAVGINQMSRSSQEYVYLRGGANYNFILPKSLPDPVVRTTDFTQNDITIRPIGLNDPLAIPPSTTRQDTVANATATTQLKSELKEFSTNTATAITQLKTTVEEHGDTLTSQAESIEGLNTSLGEKAEAKALNDTVANVTQQGKDITANTKSVGELKTRVEGAESGLAQTFESIAQAGLAQFRGFYDQRAEIVSNDTKISASINEVNVTIANETGALAQQMSTLQASVGDNAAAIQVTSSALADVSGKLSAQWGVKVQVDAQGRSYVAGMQLGIDGNGSSQFLIDADTFGIYNPNAAGGRVLAFAVSGATAYLRAAMIQDASIDFAKISDSLQSSNFVDGQTGWRLPKNGAWQVNGSVAGEGRMTINNDGISIYDGNGVLRVRLGRL